MPTVFEHCCISKCDQAKQCCCGQKTSSQKDTMYERRRLKCLVLIIFSVFLVGVVYLGYFCPERVCAFSSGSTAAPNPTSQNVASLNKLLNLQQPSQAIDYEQTEIKPFSSICNIEETNQQVESYIQGKIIHQNFTLAQLERDYRFDIDNDQDVIVFLHIQKTGGTTFGRHLVRDLQLSKPCKCHKGRKRCDCENHSDHVWLFSRYSTGWRCGLHADWTELTSCVNGMLDKIEGDIRFRRFLYITMMRDPYNRYLSEYRHVHRGATWKSARLQCNGRQASLEEVPFCFNPEGDWSGVSLQEFISCPHNLANNRQTRMLANLSLSGCYDSRAMTEDQRYCIMLDSAKANLRKMAYFGLTEYQRESQYMFERTFGLHFIEDFFQYNKTHAAQLEITEDQRLHILDLNKLDIELYQYAKELFFDRLHKALKEDGKTGWLDGGMDPSRRTDDYLEADENETEDDEADNYRIRDKKSTRAKRKDKSKHRRKRT